jgi:translation initiation factor 2 subunit 1
LIAASLEVQVAAGVAVVQGLELLCRMGMLPSCWVLVQVKDALLKNIKRRMTAQPVKIRADVELTCLYVMDGIEHIKTAIRAAEALSTEECVVKMKLVAPPLYVLTTLTLEKESGIKILNKACQACQDSIEVAKGKLQIKEAARVVSERDDRLLDKKIEELTNQNK